MQSDQPAANTAGWYPDPVDDHDLRYHNGVQWTGDVSTNGVRFVAPLLPPVPDRPSRGAPLALTTGVIALSIAWIPFVCVIGAALAVVAIVAGLKARSTHGARGQANAGLATGCAALVVAAGGIWFSVLVLNAVGDFDDPGEYETSIDSCEDDGELTTAAGSITNKSDEQRDYVIHVDFVDDGDDGRGETIEVDNVEPGATASFVVEQDFRFDHLDCTVASVTGPLPFGLDVSN